MNFIKRDTKIFIISGKARSGKNTVSKMIERYYKEKDLLNLMEELSDID